MTSTCPLRVHRTPRRRRLWAAAASCLFAVGFGPQPSYAHEPAEDPHAVHRGFSAATVPPAAPAVPDQDHEPGLSPTIAELVRQVHQASLVEIWVGQRAQQVSDSPSVRWVGRQLDVEHETLMEHVAKVASHYNLSLPSEPTQWQQAGARKMARETGHAFDLAFANTLYYGHDRVMELIRRAKEELARQPSTDPRISEFVLVGEQYVARHMQWLLATGLVTTASTESAARQVDTAQVVSRTRTFSNAIPAVIGLVSLVIIVALVASAKVLPVARRRKVPPAAARWRKVWPVARRRTVEPATRRRKAEPAARQRKAEPATRSRKAEPAARRR
jgi:predicted outer membrane protein